MVIDNIELDPTNAEFNFASEFVLHTNKLVYLTGKAGTGKTTFLKYLRETVSRNMVILAPTGVAAINAGGQTIHSFFKIKPSIYPPIDNRLRETQFRIWATQRLKEYIVKGFALNDERFKSGNSMNYFNELQERIREIRISERFFYQKIKDIYTTSIDYNPKDEKTAELFKYVFRQRNQRCDGLRKRSNSN